MAPGISDERDALERLGALLSATSLETRTPFLPRYVGELEMAEIVIRARRGGAAVNRLYPAAPCSGALLAACDERIVLVSRSSDPGGGAPATGGHPRTAEAGRGAGTAQAGALFKDTAVPTEPGVPEGSVTSFAWNDSKIFPDTKRNVYVYVPAQYDPAVPTAFMVFQDGAEPWAYFRRIVSHSGSFVNLHGGDTVKDLVRSSAPKPLRIYIQSGTNDYNSGPRLNWATEHIALAAALAEKGYHYRFVFGEDEHGGIHGAVDFPEALKWVWRGYPK